MLSSPAGPLNFNSPSNFVPSQTQLTFIWCRRQDSNSRPPHYKCGALPTELQRHQKILINVKERLLNFFSAVLIKHVSIIARLTLEVNLYFFETSNLKLCLLTESLLLHINADYQQIRN